MRRPVLIVSFVTVGILLAAFLIGLGFLHLAPVSTVKRLPLTTLMWVRPLANQEGRGAIASRLGEAEAEEVVLAALNGPRAGRLAMLRALSKGSRGFGNTLTYQVVVRLESLALDPDREVSAAARGLFSAVNLSLGWSKQAVDPRQEPAPVRPPGPDAWIPGAEAVLGFTALTYLGAGYDHRMPSKYKLYLKGLMEVLIEGQDASGRFAKDDCDHAIITIAVAELYAMSNDPALKAPLTSATAVMLRAEDGGPEGRWSANSALVVWDCMAMKSLSAGGMPHALPRMDAWRKAAPDFGRRWWYHGQEIPVSAKDLAAQQGVVGIYLGDTAATLGLSPSDLQPEPSLCPLTAYWIGLACFQVSTDYFERSQAMRDAWLDDQVWSTDPLRHGCLAADGDPVVNALRCLGYEIFYRYIPVSAMKKP